MTFFLVQGCRAWARFQHLHMRADPMGKRCSARKNTPERWYVDNAVRWGGIPREYDPAFEVRPMLILLIILLVLMFGSFPTWPHSRNWGYYPSSGLGLILVIVLILMLLNRGF
jgi:hypothetical protein